MLSDTVLVDAVDDDDNDDDDDDDDEAEVREERAPWPEPSPREPKEGLDEELRPTAKVEATVSSHCE